MIDIRRGGGAHEPVVPTGEVALGGVAGLYYRGGSLVAVQNGLPGVNRVVRLRLDAAGRLVLPAANLREPIIRKLRLE